MQKHLTTGHGGPLSLGATNVMSHAKKHPMAFLTPRLLTRCDRGIIGRVWRIYFNKHRVGYPLHPAYLNWRDAVISQPASYREISQDAYPPTRHTSRQGRSLVTSTLVFLPNTI